MIPFSSAVSSQIRLLLQSLNDSNSDSVFQELCQVNNTAIPLCVYIYVFLLRDHMFKGIEFFFFWEMTGNLPHILFLRILIVAYLNFTPFFLLSVLLCLFQYFWEDIFDIGWGLSKNAGKTGTWLYFWDLNSFQRKENNCELLIMGTCIMYASGHIIEITVFRI